MTDVLDMLASLLLSFAAAALVLFATGFVLKVAFDGLLRLSRRAVAAWPPGKGRTTR